MKSPTSNVGFMEPEGILKGSTQNERIRNTTTITGKKARAMSTTTGSGTSAMRRLRPIFASMSQMRPVITAASSSTAAKSVNLSSRPIAAMKNTGQATSRRPLRVSERSPERLATKSQRITAALKPAAIIAISSQSNPPCVNAFSLSLPVADLQDREEGFLRNLHGAHLLHAFLAGLLLFQQLAFAGDVAAVALGEHVLPQCLDVLARD